MSISDSDAERAVDYLRDSATEAAQARANRIYVEHWIKTVLAQETQASEAKTVAEREAEARTSLRYLEALDALKEAVRLDEAARFTREAAVAKVEAWRTLCSNARAG